MNRLFCFLTGGHKYENKNIETETVGDDYIVKNACIKCGKLYEAHLSWSDICKGYELMDHMKEE